MHRFLGSGQRVPGCLVLLAGERAVDVICGALAVAGCLVGGIHIDALSRDDRRGGIVKVQGNHRRPWRGWRQTAYPRSAGQRQLQRGLPESQSLRRRPPDDRVVLDLLGDGCREGFAVNRQCAARLCAVCIRTGKDKAVQTTQLLLPADRRRSPAHPNAASWSTPARRNRPSGAQAYAAPASSHTGARRYRAVPAISGSLTK